MSPAYAWLFGIAAILIIASLFLSGLGGLFLLGGLGLLLESGAVAFWVLTGLLGASIYEVQLGAQYT